MSDEIKFSSGRILDPNFGAIGLRPDHQISEGYDGSVAVCDNAEALSDGQTISTADALELCDAMIKRWTAFKEELVSHPEKFKDRWR